MHLRGPFLGPVPPLTEMKQASVSAGHAQHAQGTRGPANCVHSSPTRGCCPQQLLGWAEDCASLLLGPGEEHGERTDAPRPAESEVRGRCPRERADVCIGVLAAPGRPLPVPNSARTDLRRAPTPSSGLHAFGPGHPRAAQLV